MEIWFGHEDTCVHSMAARCLLRKVGLLVAGWLWRGWISIYPPVSVYLPTNLVPCPHQAQLLLLGTKRGPSRQGKLVSFRNWLYQQGVFVLLIVTSSGVMSCNFIRSFSLYTRRKLLSRCQLSHCFESITGWSQCGHVIICTERELSPMSAPLVPSNIGINKLKTCKVGVFFSFLFWVPLVRVGLHH